MGVRRSEERLAEAAKLYYIDELNQEEVASELGTTRSNVSRMLLAARRQGIVKFHVTYPLTRHTALEESLVGAFGAIEAHVLAADAGARALEHTAELAARWLASNLHDGQTITMTWGRSLRALTDQLAVDRSYDVTVVQFGGDLDVEPRMSSHELVRDVAMRVGGQYAYLHAPGVLDSPRLAASLRGSTRIADRLDQARQADLAIVGIGAFGPSATERAIETQHLSPAELAELEALDPAGDIAGRFFDDDGREVGPLRERVLAPDLEDLRKIPLVAGVTSGPQKGRALRGALRGGLVDVVICDQSAAAAALQLQREGD